MAHPQAIATSGLLYGANFAEWKASTTAILQVQGFGACMEQPHLGEPNSTDMFLWDEPLSYWDMFPQTDARKAATFIAMLTHPTIMQRVPSSARFDAWLLMRHLERISTQFRFLDLPAELRNRIYKLTFSQEFVVQTKCAATTKNCPAIAEVSRQIRHEALPLFYSTTTFIFNDRPSRSKLVRSVESWIMNVVGERTKDLRSVLVQLPVVKKKARGYTLTPIDMGITLRIKQGLTVKCSSELTASSQSRLQDHVASVKQACQMMDCTQDGRALFLAFVAHPSFWFEGEHLVVR